MQLLVDEKFLPAATDMIASAQKSLFVSSFKAELKPKPSGRPLVRFFEIMAEKSRLGVDVRYLTTINENRGHIPLTNIMVVRTLKANKVQVRHLRNSRICHAKLIIIDEGVAFLGSHNLCISSCSKNFEASLCFDNPHIVKQLHYLYTTMWDDAKRC